MTASILVLAVLSDSNSHNGGIRNETVQYFNADGVSKLVKLLITYTAA